MKTSKPFSTISYNSDEFLTVKLSELVQRRKIEFWTYIEHLPEEDEKKEHKHLYIVPNGQINTDEVLDFLTELDPKHPDKPLACIRPHSSKFMDWYLYSIHDPDYLASKGQSRRFHYTKDELKCSDTDYLNEEIHQMDMSKLNKTKALKSAAESGQDFATLLLNGQIPIQQVYAYAQAYDIMTQALNRNGRKTHTPKIDLETGEIIEDD